LQTKTLTRIISAGHQAPLRSPTQPNSSDAYPFPWSRHVTTWRWRHQRFRHNAPRTHWGVCQQSVSPSLTVVAASHQHDGRDPYTFFIPHGSSYAVADATHQMLITVSGLLQLCHDRHGRRRRVAKAATQPPRRASGALAKAAVST
jgi:hypothetical protein